MTEIPHDPQRIMRPMAWLVALAAVTVAECSSSAGSTAVHATSDKPAMSTATSAPTVAAKPMPTATRDSVPAVTVTVTQPPAPTPTVVVQSASHGPFRSPSGNITCTLSTPGGEIAARCEVVNHTWVAPARSPDCHLNWGDRLELTPGSGVGFNCYAQEFPAAEQTLAYGQTRSLGTITCDSEPIGITCTDSSTGHYFRISRETYELS